MPTIRERPRPILAPESCKGCGRCIDSCEHRCITAGTAIHAGTGLVPVAIDLEQCTGCGLCFAACREEHRRARCAGRGDAALPARDVSLAIREALRGTSSLLPLNGQAFCRGDGRGADVIRVRRAKKTGWPLLQEVH